MVRRYLGGEVEGARELNAALLDAVSFQSSDEAPNPLPAKAVLRVLGLPAGECRLPMGPAPDWLEPKARSMLANLDSWRTNRSARSAVTSPHA
jgi:4-hydroxy-tetrahydrodipicolinate synthase